MPGSSYVWNYTSCKRAFRARLLAPPAQPAWHLALLAIRQRAEVSGKRGSGGALLFGRATGFKDDMAAGCTVYLYSRHSCSRLRNCTCLVRAN